MICSPVQCIWRLCAHGMCYVEGDIISVVCTHKKNGFHTSKRMRPCAVQTNELHWDQGRTHLFDIKAWQQQCLDKKCICLICFFFFLIYDSLLDLTSLFDFSSCAVQKQWSDLFDLWAMTLIHMIDKCMMRFGCIFCSRKECCVKDLDCFDERFPHSCTYICQTCRCPEWAQDNATYATSSSWMLKPCLTTSWKSYSLSSRFVYFKGMLCRIVGPVFK